jgi:hypothetical protein
MQISIAIPHYNNSQYINDLLNDDIMNDIRINEIVICDDKSDNSNVHKLKELVYDLNLKNNKIKLYFNETNIGCYHNKLNTLSKCTNSWACIIDSDNIIDKSFIDKIYSLNNWDTNTIYAPMWANTFGEFPSQDSSPNLNYSQFNNQYIDSKKYIEIFNSGNQIFKCLINTCNYFVPVIEYLSTMKNYHYKRYKIDCLDSCVLFSDWICHGNVVLVVENLIYKHRLHKESNYVLSKSKMFTHEVEQNILLKLKNHI